jgi:hypothetical protein
MVRRLLLGLVLGLIVGGLAAAALVAGLHMTVFDAGAGGVALAYLAAALTGVLTGLVAGKPIWASGAKIEAGLKAFFGALIATGLMFAARRWLTSSVDLGFMGAGAGPIGELPAASLPLVAAVLGGFFELDNTGNPDKSAAADAGPRTRKRVVEDKANGKGQDRAADDEEGDAEQATPIAPKRAKR